MIRDIVPTEEFLKAYTGKFELETLYILDLHSQNISKLSYIAKCTTLILLNLSNNNISNVSDLSSLKNLNFLDLSFNQITSLDGLENLLYLRHLKLHGNNISIFPPNKFSSLKRLEKLTFQVIPDKKDKTLNISNPICQKENYRKNIFNLFCNLKTLDGIIKEIDYYFIDEEKEVYNINIKENESNFNFRISNNISFKLEDITNNNDVIIERKKIDDDLEKLTNKLEDLKKTLQETK